MRIIAGSLRGRDLGRVPKGVRPTGDRVREALFSVLGSLDGLHVLDLFAGTGALGIEAISRGANRVVFVERSRRVAAALRDRLTALNLDQPESAELWVMDARQAIRRLARAGAQFDLVLVDPPYDSAEQTPLLEVLFAEPILATGATVVVERAKRHPLAPLIGARRTDERRYGDTVLTWLAPVASNRSPHP